MLRPSHNYRPLAPALRSEAASDSFTDLEMRALDLMLAGVERSKAARLAGYSEASYRLSAKRLWEKALALGVIADHIGDETKSLRLLANNRLRQLLESEETSSAIVLKAAELVLRADQGAEQRDIQEAALSLRARPVRPDDYMSVLEQRIADQKRAVDELLSALNA